MRIWPVFVLYTFAFGQTTTAVAPHLIRASGEATISVKPDRARIDIGVVTGGETAGAAATANAAQMQKTLDALRKALGDKVEIRTVNYSVNPNYGPQQKGPVYQASNTLQVTLNDMTDVAKTIDAASQTGANVIQRLQFGLRDESVPRAKALEQASLKARADAETIARALGLKVKGVYSAETGGGGGPVPLMREMAMIASAPTPVESGTVDVHASVTVTLVVE